MYNQAMLPRQRVRRIPAAGVCWAGEDLCLK